jgi:histidinol-phosphate aminotransferase
MKYYVDENIKNTLRIFPEQGRYGYHRYDLNENPEGLPKDFVDDVLKEITPEFLSIYPEPDNFLHKYAKFIGAAYENVLTTNGSDMAIRYLLETFGEKNKEVVTVAPSFEMYRVNCSLLGLKHVPVTYREDLTIDIKDIINAISEDTRIVVLINPNNPMGNVYTEEELEQVIERAHQVNAIVIVDEAYHYFYNKTFLKYALEGDNVIILRTFSKLMSLAACRLGVVISNPELIHYVKNIRMTFEVNSFALLFAERLLDNPQIIDSLIQSEKEGKAYTINTLKEHGYWCKDCTGNFIFVEPKKDPVEIAQRLKAEKNILIHTFGNDLLKKYLRISIGSVAAMKIFLDAFLTMDHE